ncbi:metal-dependent hydrolase [Methanoregula sp. UBA64]|jgi:hypothetical protein|uniref:metal-dependent hydrolase n=1 Tax=Methanoregula sp. UBA64 TaxID=1915554 RepID=UPI0025F3E64B|nr:metal-dependent hydrolase [Methanoregula sp. UBA64]
MITRHHLALALMCALIASSAFLFSPPGLVCLVTAGTCIGVLLPDIHMTRPKHFKFRSFAWLIVQFPRRICAPLLCRIYAHTRHPVQDPGDKRLSHSLPGALFVFACTALLLLIPASVLKNTFVTDAIFVFLAGVFLGIFLHLIEDLCTRKGIVPCFPFSAVTITGTIRPCDTIDPRIGQYHIQHCAVLLIIVVIETTGILSSLWIMLLSIAGFLFCQVTMIGFSEVTIHWGKSQTDKQPLPLPAEGITRNPR